MTTLGESDLIKLIQECTKLKGKEIAEAFNLEPPYISGIVNKKKKIPIALKKYKQYKKDDDGLDLSDVAGNLAERARKGLGDEQIIESIKANMKRLDYDDGQIFKIAGDDLISVFEELIRNSIPDIGSPKKAKSNLQNAYENLHLLKHDFPGVLSLLIGREAEIQKIDELFMQGNSVVVLYGIGGIGKSSIARTYAKQNEGRFNYIQSVVFDKSIRNTVMKLRFSGIDEDKRSEMDADENYQQKLHALHEQDEGSLLIIDNMDDMDDDEMPDFFKLISGKCRILVTTRLTVFDKNYSIQIGELSKEAQLRLFLDSYLEYKQEEFPIYQQILNIVGGHTLAIEMVAKTMHDNDIPANEMRDRLQKSIAVNEDEGIHVTFRDTVYSNMTAVLHMLFGLSRLTGDETYILMILSLVPISGITRKEFSENLGDNPNQARSVINSLSRRGWVIINKKNIIHVHPVISDVILQTTSPAPENCIDFLDRLEKKLQDNTLNYDEAILYSSIMHNIASKLCFEGLKQGEFLQRIAYSIYLQSMYGMALDIYQIALETADRLGEQGKKLRIDIYNGIALTYRRIASYDKSIENYEYAANESEGLNDVKSMTHTNIAFVYRKKSEYTSSIRHYEQALKLREKAEKAGLDKNLQLAEIYNGLGLVYENCKDYDKALQNFEIALKIREKFADQWSDLAYSYHNIGTVYQKKGEYYKAVDLHQKAYNIRSKYLQETNEAILASKNMIGVDYGEMGDIESALSHLENVLTVRQMIFEGNHPDIAWSYYSFGRVYEVRGGIDNQYAAYGKAFEEFKKSYDMRIQCLDSNHIYTADSLYHMAFNRFRMWKLSKKKSELIEAFNFAKQAMAIQENKEHSDRHKTQELLDKIEQALTAKVE